MALQLLLPHPSNLQAFRSLTEAWQLTLTHLRVDLELHILLRLLPRNSKEFKKTVNVISFPTRWFDSIIFLRRYGVMNGTYFDIRDIDEISKIATIHNSQIGAMNASIDFMAMALHMNSVTTVGLILDWKSVGRQWCKPVTVTCFRVITHSKILHSAWSPS